ncbi:MAG: (Fe-S)-binding protein [Candidatus Nezhaarchaeota archaeon]|nr:(Fe-S)-binding protein [Candidatus Nezhaarchaeota archaeon]MCX8142372.1 (Fe-S)-binding protein [Candidatus Nezhaarchaeota archaeon]MDW8050655.1 (Fe-S)-binding protein [Nitrososphaerota archaeon]
MSGLFVEQFKDQVYRCIRCGYCRDFARYRDSAYKVCPLREGDATPGFEPYSARGRLMLIRFVLEGRLPLNEKLAELVYTCSTCRNCWDKCYVSQTKLKGEHMLNQVEIYEAFRHDLFKAGLISPRHKQILEWTEKEHNPYLERHEDRTKWVHEGIEPPPSKGDVLYFVGCTASYRHKNIATATVRVLRKAGINVALLYGNEWCCGSPMMRIGHRDLAKQLAEHNVAAIEETGAKTVVFSCSGCYRAFKIDYPLHGLQPKFELRHAIDLALQLINEGRLSIKKEFKHKITYHDPCHVGRHLLHIKAEIFEQPREIIKKIPGAELIEMERNRRNSWCCGAGGGLRSYNAEVSLALAKNRIKEAEKTSAEVVTSICPFCYRNLSDAIQMTGSHMKMYDLMEILDVVTE